MKLVTLYLDNKRITQVLDFTHAEVGQSSIREYVIESRTDSVLFEFANSEPGTLGRLVDLEDEPSLNLLQENDKKPSFEWNKESGELRIRLRTKSKRDEKVCSLPSVGAEPLEMGGVRLCPTDEGYVFKLVDSRIEVLRLTLEIDGVCHSIDIKLYSARKIYRAVVDFGSESSQALINCGGNVGDEDVTKLFDAVKTTYVGQEGSNIPSAEFMQFDPSVSSAFKSIYYVAKQVDCEYELENTWSIVGENEKIFRAVTRRDEKSVAELNKNFFRLSNTKIDSMGSAQVSSIKVGDLSISVNQFKNGAIYRLAINCILSEVIKRVSMLQNLAFGSDATCGLRLTILMPNVYDPNMVAEKLAAIREDVHKMIESDGSKWKRVSGIEVSMVSESDASLLGAIAAGAINPNDTTNYLVLDCGKGTLDFSVLGYNPNNITSYRSLCRGGIIGAGNALTYSVLYGMVNHFLVSCCSGFATEESENQREKVKQFIFNHIINLNDPAKINEIIDCAEDRKRSYGSLKRPKSQREQQEKRDFKNLTYSDFMAFAKDSQYFCDSDIEQFVKAQIKTIVHNVITDLQKVLSPTVKAGVSSIVFTGRGFLMSSFREEMFESLKSQVFDGRDITCVIPITPAGSPERDAKRLCLFIPNVINAGTYDGSLMNTAWGVHGVEKPEENHFLDKFFSKPKIKEMLNKYFPVASLNEGSNEGVDISTHLGYTDMTFVHNDPIVNIGGVEYRLSSVYNSLQYERACIFFDGEKFRLSVKNRGDFDMPPRTQFGGSLYYDSLFPFVTLANPDELNTPTEPKGEEPKPTEPVSPEQQSSDDEQKKPNRILDLLSEYWSAFANWMKKKFSNE